MPALRRNKRKFLRLNHTQPGVRNGGGMASILPREAYNYDGGSDTEPDDEEHDLTIKYAHQINMPQDQPPVETVFGKGVIVTKSFGGRLYACLDEGVKASEDSEALDVQTLDEEPKTSKADEGEGEVKYPSLPALPAEHRLPSEFPVPEHKKMGEGTYKERKPNDTLYSHRGSAGIDMNGAHSRPAFPSRIKPLVRDRLHRRYGIVSGSFGSFEGGDVDRFDEREYRLGLRGEKTEPKKPHWLPRKL
jgi:hypothetical protein